MINDALLEAFGTNICSWLANKQCTDIMLNADGKIWIDTIDQGRRYSECRLAVFDADTALRIIADHCGTSLTRNTPLLSATLPETGERIAATIPPITERPTFAIRIPPRVTFKEKDFYASTTDGGGDPVASVKEIFTTAESGSSATDSGNSTKMIAEAIKSRKNILICGGTGSGKTSLLSALLQRHEIARDRVVVIEDTAELDLRAIPDSVRFLTCSDVDQRRLVEHALRYRPDRIILGEVRSGDVAVSLLNALNSGHPGSFVTVHADGCRQALHRLELLCEQGCGHKQSEAIAAAIGCVVFMRRTATCRTISEVVTVEGYARTSQRFVLS